MEPASCDTDRRLIDNFVSSLRAQFMSTFAGQPPTAAEIRSEVRLGRLLDDLRPCSSETQRCDTVNDHLEIAFET